MTIDDTVHFAKALATLGIDVVDCSSGGIGGRYAHFSGYGYQVTYAHQVKEQSGLATMAVGLIVDPLQAQQIVESGSADLVAIGRQALENPNSVARPLSQSSGLAGKRGVLLWSIAQFLQQCISNGNPTKYLIFENVDRLLSSPASHRGRDFAVILATLHAFGYAAEWRVIDAADYGNLASLISHTHGTKDFAQLNRCCPTVAHVDQTVKRSE